MKQRGKKDRQYMREGREEEGIREGKERERRKGRGKRGEGVSTRLSQEVLKGVEGGDEGKGK